MDQTAWLAAWLMFGVVPVAAAQTAQAAKLTGLPEAVHVMVTVDSLAQAAGVNEDTLRAQVESRLREEGFSVMTVFAGSNLIVEVHAFQVSTTAMLVYDVGLEYRTFAIPARQLSAMIRGLPDRAQIPVGELAPLVQRSVDVALYRRAVYGVGPRKQAGAVANVVMRNLQVFVSDFRSVNPPER